MHGVTAADNSILCTEDYCKNYPGPSDTPCPTLPSRCNKTDPESGIFLASPTPCNCCDFCIGYLNEGDSCSTGEETSDSPSEICGPKLYCDQATLKCRPMMETICTEAQMKYDQDKAQGKIGDYQIRPICDSNGDYVPYHCTPGGICYCVDKDGNRVFGSMDNNGKAAFELPCTCSRNHKEMSAVIGRELHPGEYFRCTQNGAYESLQCIDDQTCLCVDAIDGAPTYKDVAPVEIWAISATTLPCFNSSIYQKEFL
ncbi:hypothetical protein HHI36_002822 [Cryptolaemus montrouzieri]|uniref:Thyroglobulin type-1 domain-containing protein n=1 Tax=Cryptolaemus montrouzieri TaxID=559131 RepID=A0ABD2PBP4_9CUCU